MMAPWTLAQLTTLVALAHLAACSGSTAPADDPNAAGDDGPPTTMGQVLTRQDACGCESFAIPECGSSDIADKDYDKDGTPNCEDDDADGDGIANGDDCVPLHSWESIIDCSQGDLSDKDYDHDGTRNCEDPDIDGDGHPNVCDADPYHDGTSNK